MKDEEEMNDGTSMTLKRVVHQAVLSIQDPDDKAYLGILTPQQGSCCSRNQANQVRLGAN